MPTVLIVDDDTPLLELLSADLTSGGLKVRIAADAAIAIRAILESPPDLILLDIGLPYLDGMEVLAALKSDPASRDIPVVVLTGHQDENEHVQARNLGAEGFLHKPVARETLINEIFSRLAWKAAKKLANPPPV
ncbi:MAG: response regulator [Betaproteobacteria bacterium]|nr:response regulator [Betaproteobacteria bacterium]